MALIQCKECGREISDIARTCPHCGYPIQAVKNAEIDQQNRQYYRKFNVKLFLYNLIAFGVSFAFGVWGLSGETKLWAIGLFVLGIIIICVGATFFFLSFLLIYGHKNISTSLGGSSSLLFVSDMSLVA